MKKLIIASTIALTAFIGGDTAYAKPSWFVVWNKALVLSAEQHGGNPLVTIEGGVTMLSFQNKGITYTLREDPTAKDLARLICSYIGNSPQKCINFDTGETY